MRVLIVEDDLALAKTLRAALVREGFVVAVARNGVDGLFEASEHAYDVIVLDIMLPGLSGYRVVQQLRGRNVWTPVLMLTAKDGPYDQADALDLGADDYLTKPYDIVVLTAHLRALARRGAPVRPTNLTVGDLTLDPSTHRVARAGREIELTAKEFTLLEFLMRNAGQVLSKPQLLEGVWDPGFEGELNIVEVYIGYLRKKIDAPFGTNSIQTLRGVGYRMISPTAE